MIITIPEALRAKLGPEGARALAELLNQTSVSTRGDVIEFAANRFERQLADELGAFRVEVRSAIAGVREELRSEVGELREEMHSEMGKLRAELGAFEGRITRWMFIFWIGQIGALLGILFAFFRG